MSKKFKDQFQPDVGVRQDHHMKQARKVIDTGWGSNPQPLLASQVLYQLRYLGQQFCLRFVSIYRSELNVLHIRYNAHFGSRNNILHEAIAN